VDGKIPLTQEKSVAGIPVKVSMVDIHTVGAGGGSIAHMDVGRALKVGPQSAGADPGPVCYGKGEAITVTDANLFLGRLDADHFLGGKIRLNPIRTAQSMKRWAKQIGLAPVALAWGILRAVNSNMERAIRAVSVERGHDPKEFGLIAFGGAGSLHAAELVEALRIPHLLIPEIPGLLSAWGMARTPISKDYSLSVLEKEPDFLIGRGLKEMEQEGVRKKETEISLSVDMRYPGQAYEITVPWGKDFIRRFHQHHETRFGHSDPEKEVEVVTLRVHLESRRALRKERPLPLKRGPGRHALLGHQKVYFAKRFVRCPLYQRESMAPGERIRGPAVVYEFSSTTVVPPSWRAVMDGYRNLHLIRV
jgi:N-methylhydantoinase A